MQNRRRTKMKRAATLVTSIALMCALVAWMILENYGEIR
jgi:hypothetical protein